MVLQKLAYFIIRRRIGKLVVNYARAGASSSFPLIKNSYLKWNCEFFFCANQVFSYGSDQVFIATSVFYNFVINFTMGEKDIFTSISITCVHCFGGH